MKTCTTLILLIFISGLAIGQLDDRPYSFKRNLISIGVGNHYAGDIKIFWTNELKAETPLRIDLGVERNINNLLSIGLVYSKATMSRSRYIYNYDGYRMMLNYHPLGFHNKHQVKISSGPMFSNQTEYLAGLENMTLNRTSSGAAGSIEYHRTFFQAISIGGGIYTQIQTNAPSIIGWRVQTGILF